LLTSFEIVTESNDLTIVERDYRGFRKRKNDRRKISGYGWAVTTSLELSTEFLIDLGRLTSRKSYQLLLKLLAGLEAVTALFCHGQN